MPLNQSSISKYEAKVELLLNNVEEEKKRLLEDAKKEAENIKTRANLIVQEAEANAQKIIEQAKKEAENIIKNADEQKNNLSSETEQIQKQAFDEGIEKGRLEGIQQVKEESKIALESLNTLTSSSFEIKKSIITSAEKDIIDLVLAIAKKITTKSFDDKMLKEITLAAISQLKNKEKITIIVNPELINNILSISEELKQEIAQLESINIIEDSSLSPDGVIVETPLSRVDSRISSIIDEIAKNLINGIADEIQ